MVSGYPTSTSIPRVDGLSKDPRDLGGHTRSRFLFVFSCFNHHLVVSFVHRRRGAACGCRCLGATFVCCLRGALFVCHRHGVTVMPQNPGVR